MKNMWPPQDQTLWYVKKDESVTCDKDMSVQVAIIGGGMAGLSAAQECVKLGKKVAVFEQYYCGSGATGKSSGFITPNAELSLTDFSKRFSMQDAGKIWNFISYGVEHIASNIKTFQLQCDYIPARTMMVASSKRVLKKFATEHKNLEKLGFKASLYNADELKNHIGSKGYFGGVAYENTFGINAYAYCQEMKKQLQVQGVAIFEETPVTNIDQHTISTAHAKITADYIIVCTDRFLPDLHILTQDVYHAQTFIMISQQLSDDQIRAIFPKEKLMVWDSEFIYNYFRLTADNRLLLGGGDIFTTYASSETHGYHRIVKKLTKSFRKKFPDVDIQFEYMWPGLIGLSKDIAPLAGPDKDFKHIYYVAACAGLPISAAFGIYSAQHLFAGRTDMDHYFSPYRSFPIGGTLQSILGTKLTFVLCNLLKQNVP
ncbi:MAG TPA: FAD-binding oxidoreductase [Candidatus Saccharimonadales bacterium]|nr:FAD-binding oxidoreductase [Candidatus Saccharimonadales bacterium]